MLSETVWGLILEVFIHRLKTLVGIWTKPANGNQKRSNLEPMGGSYITSRGGNSIRQSELRSPSTAQIDPVRKKTLAALREHQPLIVLVSLSLIIATFADRISSAAVGYAVAASVAFLAGLILSLLRDAMTDPKDPDEGSEFSTASVVGIIIGFGLLTLVVIEFSLAVELVRNLAIFIFISGFLATMVFVSVMAIRRGITREPEDWARWWQSGTAQAIVGTTMLASALGLIGSTAVSVFVVGLPAWFILTFLAVYVGSVLWSAAIVHSTAKRKKAGAV